MDKIIVTKKTSAIFLVIVLVTGTITLMHPSFMAGAQAQPYYGQDNNYDKKSDKKDVSVKNVKCNNVNVNVNGLELNTTTVPFLNNLLTSEGQDGYGDDSSYGSGSYGVGGQQSGYDKNNNNFKFVCINNNNNTVVVVNETTSEEPTTGTLRVIKQVTCTEEQLPNSISVQQAVTPCLVLEELVNENDFIIRVVGNFPVPSQFRGSPEGTDVTLGSGNYLVTEEFPPIPIDVLFPQFPNIFSISMFIIYSGDCTAATPMLSITATGAIESGELQTCNIENKFLIELRPQSAGLATSDINTDTSAFDINTAGNIAPSFSSQPTISQETEEDSSSALAKIEKLKQQWLDLLP